MPAGGHSSDIDAIPIEVVFIGVGVDPTDGAEGVLVARRCRCARDETIFDRQREVTQSRPLVDIGRRAQSFPVAVVPASSVDADNDWVRPVAGWRRDGGQ